MLQTPLSCTALDTSYFSFYFVWGGGGSEEGGVLIIYTHWILLIFPFLFFGEVGGGRKGVC